MASPSTAATLSWSSSSWLHSSCGPTNEISKLPDKRTSLVFWAQKKAKNTRKIEEERIEAEKKTGNQLFHVFIKEEAQQLALIFDTVGAFKVNRKGGKGKQIFGSVTAEDLVDIIKAQLQRSTANVISNIERNVLEDGEEA